MLRNLYSASRAMAVQCRSQHCSPKSEWRGGRCAPSQALGQGSKECGLKVEGDEPTWQQAERLGCL